MRIEDFLSLVPEGRRELLKRKIRETMQDRAQVSVEWVASELGKKPYTLYKWADENCPSHNMPLHHLVYMMHATGDLELLDFIEAMFGRAAFRLPVAQPGLVEINEETRRAIKEFSDYLGEVAGAVQDARVTRLELEAIERECSQAMAQLAALLEAVRQLHKNNSGGPLKAVAGD